MIEMNSYERDIKKEVLLFLAVLLIFVSSIPVMAASQDEKQSETIINILHTNDVHGRIYQVDDNNAEMIGIDRIAEIKKNTENAILVDVGDAVHGLPIVNMNEGLNAIELMVAAGYSVMTPGNHDYNFGSARLSELAAIASSRDLDIISSNTFDKSTGENFLKTTKIIEVDGIKIGFFGLTTQTTSTTTNPVNVESLEFRVYKESSEDAIAELKKNGAIVIVALAHVSRVEVEELIAALDEKPDIILDGHDHILSSAVVDGVLIAQVGEYQENLGQVSITINSNGEILEKTEMVITKADTADIAGDADVKALAETMKQAVLELYSEVVATSEIFLSSQRGTDDGQTLGLRNSEQALGNLVADSMRVIGNPDIAIINGGGIRADIKEGEITKGDINSVMPFGNILVIKEATPKALKEIMENGLKFAPVVDGRFPQISGMNVLYDQSNSPGEKVISITVNGKDLDFTDDTTIYKLATNDFMAHGGDGYTAVQALQTVAEMGALDEILGQYIISLPNKTITADDAKIEGRITQTVQNSNSSMPNQQINQNIDMDVALAQS
jgi:2',3'-cyclic-nucleotide 2'-phosphodiesterase (5'-nucleotidase family)